MTTSEIDRSPTWNAVAKILIAIIGAMLATAISWLARASDKSAQALIELKDAVYQGQTKMALVESRITVTEREQERMDSRIKRVETKLFEGPSK